MIPPAGAGAHRHRLAGGGPASRRRAWYLASIGDNVQTFVTSTHLNDFSAAWLEQADIYRVEVGELKLMKSMKDQTQPPPA